MVLVMCFSHPVQAAKTPVTTAPVEQWSLGSMLFTAPPCQKPGWFPTGFGLKDHTIFWHAGYYYLVSIYLPGETQFAYGRSTDLCTWETLAPILTERRAGSWDEYAVWAPHVFVENGVYYMYYTGVTNHYTQSILLATTTNPAEPASWEEQGVVFQPDHPGDNWQAGQWADCRDPAVFRIGPQLYLYYTAADETGGIIGLATAADPAGPWRDWGTVIDPVKLPSISREDPGEAAWQSSAAYMPSRIQTNIPESATIFYAHSSYYLFYHYSGGDEVYRIGPSPAGPWSEPRTIAPGWAHEVWTGQAGQVYTSYLTSYAVTISPLTWNMAFDPPRPFIGSQVFNTILPLILR